MAWLLLKKGPASPVVVPDISDLVGRRPGCRRIRCPLCQWTPSPSSVWACYGEGTPEPAFRGCGTVWHTFETGGRCPGCAHQWQWTSCLRCHGWSRHLEWYEVEGTDP